MHQVIQPVHRSAIVLVDVINDLEFPGGDHLLRSAQPMARQTAALKQRARQAGIPAIYINGPTERWKPSFSRQVDRCLNSDVRGRPIVELLRPQEHDYFFLKSQQPVCFLTNLDVLLEKLHIQTLILTGMVSDICVLFSANDAYLSNYQFIVPCDCVASKTEKEAASALRQLQLVLDAEVCPSDDLLFQWT